MDIDDGLFADTLRAGCPDVIHGQRVNHRGTDIPCHAAKRRESHNDQRQRHIVHSVRERLPASKAGAG
ncbi:hypothetical protein SDC9_182830 [bioreactor metagenome]|uniref:Uncharacterized protein n=1 Tax=bioreactor metagenome TaxID=1076179 RepID=A0A645HI36_9ZZZZ